jgi:hypothetical protein
VILIILKFFVNCTKLIDELNIKVDVEWIVYMSKELILKT